MRTRISTWLAAIVLAVVFGGAVNPMTNAAVASEPEQTPAAAQSGELVTQEELCAFRAPLLVDEDEVPAGCVAVVEWLRRVIDADSACGDLWLRTGAIPECALPYR